jgi:hypothetical protein
LAATPDRDSIFTKVESGASSDCTRDASLASRENVMRSGCIGQKIYPIG